MSDTTPSLQALNNALIASRQEADALRVQLAQAEARAAALEARLRVVLTHSSIVLFAFDDSDRFTEQAGRGVTELGMGAREAVGTSVSELAAMLPGAEAAMQHALAGKVSRWSGTRRGAELEITMVPMLHDDGTLESVLGIALNVTERNRAIATLRQSEEKYRRIVETTEEGVWTIDADANTTFMNRRMGDLLGESPDAALGRSLFSFMDEAGQAVAMRNLERRREGLPERHPFRFVRSDGTTLWASVETNPLFDASGAYDGALAMVRDLGQLRAAEEVRTLHATIVDLTDEAIFTRDTTGIIRTWNRSAERLLQYTAEEAIGAPSTMLYPPAKAREYVALREAIDKEGVSRDFVAIALRRDGTPVEVEVKTKPLHDADGTAIGTCVLLRDLTAQRQVEAALRRSEDQLRQVQKMEAVDSLAGGIAHDFNNLLTVILSFTDLIIEDLHPTDPLRADMEQIRDAGNRATALTRQLLAFSRRQILTPRTLDLSWVARGVEKLLRRVLGENIMLTLLLDRHVSNVFADPSQIEQVLMNLVVNARDAMPEGGQLTIEVANAELSEAYADEHVDVKPGSYVMLAVSDTGTGIAPDLLPRIFDPFFTTKPVDRGTGLGLSTAYGIVKQTGGHLWVYSEVGVGTTFRVYLPQTDRITEAAAPPPIAADLRGTETILLVEDDDTVRRAMSIILQRQGYHVLNAQNGGEALLMCEQFSGRIHLLLTDVVMPRMNGKLLAQRLTSVLPSLRVLYVSGYTENTIVHHGILDAGIAYLQKPITPDALARKVREVLDAAR